jgi:hypothetical protein
VGEAWPAAERALADAVRAWLRSTRVGARIDLTRSPVADELDHQVASARDVEQRGTIVVLRMSAAAGWVVVRSAEWTARYCIDIERHDGQVQLTPRLLHFGAF